MLMNQLKESADYIRARTKTQPTLGVTLGSGLSSFVDHMQVEAQINYAEIPHFCPPSVSGHPGSLVLGRVGKNPVAVLQGRIHFYEGYSYEQVIYPVRVLAQLGVTTHILTNASGGIDPNMKPGDFMLIEDHLNLTGNNPLIGPNHDELGPRFPDMTEVYDRALTDKLALLLSQKNIRFHRGVYCGVLGPSYESPAEIRYLQKIGGHAVGMSTVPEAIALRHMGIKTVGIACITNLAAGLSDGVLTHEEVKETAKKVELIFSDFLKDFMGSI